MGAWLRRRLEGPVPSIAAVSDRGLGLAVASVPFAAGVAAPLAMAPLLGVVAMAVLRTRRASRLRERALTRDLADVLDLLALVVGAGLTLPAAIRSIAPWVPAVYRPVLADSVRLLDTGASLTDVLQRLGAAGPAGGRRSIAVLGAAVRDGTAVGPSLTRAADEARRARRRAVETEVRRLPVVLLVPLVVCVLPAFVLLTLVPLVLGSLDGLQLPGS